jgi:uncharacterized protein
MDNPHADIIARHMKLRPAQVVTVFTLLDEGCTIPFLARYRKERTGGLDEEQLREIQAAKAHWETLDARKAAILKSLAEQGVLTDILRQAVQGADNLTILEDLYLPYRPKRKTRAAKAIELGLEPLAKMLCAQPGGPSPEEAARKYVGKDVPSVESALSGAKDIVAEWSAEQPEIRQTVRDKAFRFGTLVVLLKKGAEDPKETYRSYYDHRGSVSRLAPHQVLAIDRGEREKVLKVDLEMNERDWKDPLWRAYRPKANSPWGALLIEALEDGAQRLLLPAVERDVRRSLTEKAQAHAIEVFAGNLRSLLLIPPLANQVVLAIDPGFRTGCKLAVVDQTGKLLETATIFPHPPQKQTRESLALLSHLVKKHKVTLIAIGNGTASRESEQLAADLVKEHSNLAYLMVSEAGASVYSASPLAKAELPGLDVSLRGAVSIARRVLDPLAELIKIDPKSVGVGLYQHDLDEKRLDGALASVVESVVHSVGVELNTASPTLLSHVGGIGPKMSEKIVAYREKNGPFASRAALTKVSGLGPKAFEQSAGFLRIRDGADPLDATAIHPESYSVARQVVKLADGNTATLDFASVSKQVACPEPTLRDIVEQLQKPGRDPRMDLPAPVLRKDVLSLRDLHPGMTLSGTVRNVVDFGAFVDLGVKQDGLLHRSQLKGKRVSVGDVLELEILEIDNKRGRIALGLS